ncbi:MAG: response regulator transcription factor [Acidimicrobiales bacterium]
MTTGDGPEGAATAQSAKGAQPVSKQSAWHSRVTVVLADDHPIWRSGVRADLGENFQVVGEAGDATEAIAVIAETKPDLVVCDLHMPNGGGLKVARACGDTTNIVMLTVSEAERDLLDAVAAGACGYLVKSTPPQELRDGLWRAAHGEPVFSPQLASLVLGEFRRMSKAAGGVQPLSEREREVLQYVARGHTYKEIGEELFISPKTVENHVRNILGKLHLNRKQELVRYALEHGIE